LQENCTFKTEIYPSIGQCRNKPIPQLKPHTSIKPTITGVGRGGEAEGVKAPSKHEQLFGYTKKEARDQTPPPPNIASPVQEYGPPSKDQNR